MFLFVYFRGWLYRLLWRFTPYHEGTAPSLYTAWRAYGIRPKPRMWVDEWYMTGCWAAEDGQPAPLRSKIAWYLRRVGI